MVKSTFMKKFHIRIKAEKCKGCQLCVHFCPKGVLRISGARNKKGYHPPEVIAPDRCIGCLSCVLVCPDTVLEIYEEESQ